MFRYLPEFLLATATLLFAGTCWGLDQRLKIAGVWDGEILEVARIKQRDPAKNVRRIRISGAVSEHAPGSRSMRIGPIKLRWLPDDHERFAAIKNGDLLQVDALQAGSAQFVATRFGPADLDSSDSVELIGALTGYQNDPEWTELQLAGISARAPKRLFRNGRMRLQRLDDKRPNNQFAFNLGHVEVTLGGELELRADAETDRDLDHNAEDRRVDFDQGAQLEAFFDFGDTVSAFAELKLQQMQRYEFPWQRTRSRSELKRGELWIYVNQPLGLSPGIQIGRQNFAEDREWWWDTDLDAIRLDARLGGFAFELAFAEEIGREILSAVHADPEEKDISRLLARGTLLLVPALALDFFYVRQNDHSSQFLNGEILPADREDPDDADLTWTGARASGGLDLTHSIELEYWIDVARVRGNEIHYDFGELASGDLVTLSVNQQHRKGSAIDSGTIFTWREVRMGALSEPTITLGFARGSGSDDSNGTFVQTGLNDNNGKFNGVDRFRYYGELTRPELSNLRVTTAAIGFRLGEDNSIELLHHTYRQEHLSTLQPLRINANANGLSDNLGEEIDVVMGLEKWQHWEIEAVLSHFMPGGAFDTQRDASGFFFKLDYNF